MVRLYKKQVPIDEQGRFDLPLPKNYDEATFPQFVGKHALVHIIDPWFKDLEHYATNPLVQEFLQNNSSLTTRDLGEIVQIKELNWNVSTGHLSNGYMSTMSLGDGKGALCIQEGHGTFIPYTRIGHGSLKEFKQLQSNQDGMKVATYQQYNVNNILEASFLRAWGMRYLNGIFIRQLME